MKNEYCWYTVVTLRDSCIKEHIDRVRKYYPAIEIYVVDNCAEFYNIESFLKDYKNIKVIKNDIIYPLTFIQNIVSELLFKNYNNLFFASDDVMMLEGGFIEKSLEKIKNGAKIVSLSTDEDPIAYVYNEDFFKEVGFNLKLYGKECTDTDLIKRVKSKYSSFESIGGFWTNDQNGWRSKYCLNPHVGKHGKTEVNQQLENLNLESGRIINKSFI